MIKRITALLLSMLCAVPVLTSCEKKDPDNPTYSVKEDSPETTEPITYVTAEKKSDNDVKAADDGPRLSINNVTAGAGETAEVTVSVENAEAKWSMCGLHITYPDELKPVFLNEAEDTIKFKKGSASDYSTAAIGMYWRDNLPAELTDNHLGSVFFTEMFNGNTGMDGDIVTLYFEIPMNAKSGTVYPIGFYVMDTDMFINNERDKAMQKYTFEHLTEGSITVK